MTKKIPNKLWMQYEPIIKEELRKKTSVKELACLLHDKAPAGFAPK
jgi:hypothetical protein